MTALAVVAGYSQWQPDSSAQVNSLSSEQSGAMPLQSELQSQPGCPMQLPDPEKSEHDRAEPLQVLLEEAQKQPWMAVHEYTLNWP